MNRLSVEHWHVQNPALGGFLQWRFCTGYTKARADAAGSPFALLFLVLPMVLYAPTLAMLSSTRLATGLRGFASKFGTSKFGQSDILLGLHDRADSMRLLSLQSIQVAIAYRLISVDSEAGSCHPLSQAEPRSVAAATVRELARNSEKFGAWCSQLTSFEVATILKVCF